MEHSFNIFLAKEVGINGAVILKHLFYWVQKNKANDKHFHDGRYWTYSSCKAFTEIFPYLSERQIRSALKLLEEKGYIVSGNYNDTQYDHTTWYSLTEKCDFTKCQIDFTKCQIETTKCKTNTIYNTDINIEKENYIKEKEDFERVEPIEEETPKLTQKQTLEQAEEIYQLYPKKVGKAGAINAIAKAIKSGKSVEYLKIKTSLYAEKSSWKERQYIPHPQTWFNQARYDDDPREWENPRATATFRNGKTQSQGTFNKILEEAERVNPIDDDDNPFK